MAVDSHVCNEWCIKLLLVKYHERNEVETSSGVSMFVLVQPIQKEKKMSCLNIQNFDIFQFGHHFHLKLTAVSLQNIEH